MDYIATYDHVVATGGHVEFKTDNDDLYAFTLGELEKLGYDMVASTENFHDSPFNVGNVRTEYEEKFSSEGKNINYVKWKCKGGAHMIFAQENGRKMPKEDKIFAISGRAKARIAAEGKAAVVNGTIGALLDDNGDLAVLSSVVEAIKQLSPKDYAEYAPIGGLPAFKNAVKKAAFGGYKPTCNLEVCATPGGTGAIRNTVSNYSAPGDVVLTSDWFWAPYNTICMEMGRSLETYPLFDENGSFNLKAFDSKVNRLMDVQRRLVILLNTPAHNPTGYSLKESDWKGICAILESASAKGKITLFVDVAYIDFAGDEEDCRFFFPILETMPEEVLPIVGYSASKTLTLYGMRLGAMICMAKTPEIAAEFKQVTEFSSRGTWSNCVRSGQALMAAIYEDSELLARIGEERKEFRDMLLARGKAFEKSLREEGVENVPFDAGFFTCIPTDKPEEICDKLEAQGIYIVPLAKGVRISVASISEEMCVKVAKTIARTMK